MLKTSNTHAAAARKQFTQISPNPLYTMHSGPAALDAPSHCAERNQDFQTALLYQRSIPGLYGPRRLKEVTHRGTHCILYEESHTRITSLRIDYAIWSSILYDVISVWLSSSMM